MSNPPKNKDLIVQEIAPISAVITYEEAKQLTDRARECVYHINNMAFELGAIIKRMDESGGYRLMNCYDIIQWAREYLYIRRRTVFNLKKLDDFFQERLRNISGYFDLHFKVHYSKILQLQHIILDKDEYGKWKHSDDEVLQWVHTANNLCPEELAQELKHQTRSIEPDPLITRVSFTLHGGRVENNGAVTLTITDFTNSWNASLESILKIFKGKTIHSVWREEK